MNKTLINFIATIVLAYVLSLFMDWYSVMIASALTGLLIPLKRFAVFFIPFIAIFILWAIYSYSLASNNDFILAKKVATLLDLNGNTTMLIVVTGIVGGLAAGISGILGKQLSILFSKD
jgi:hypothetical protein